MAGASSGAVAVLTVPIRTRRAAVVQLAGRLPQPVHGIEHGEDARQQIPARAADPRAVAAALKQVDAELPLQAAHRLAQRRLRDVQRLGRPAERAEAGHPGDVLQLLDTHSLSQANPFSWLIN